MNWAGLALQRIEARAPTALVTVVGAEGSTPRERGARMLVGEAWMSGTIGGGNLEWLAADQARRLLRQSERDYAVQDYPLGPLLSQCCGGRVRLLLERIGEDSRGWLGDADQALRLGRPFALQAEFGPSALKRSVVYDDDQWPGLFSTSTIRLIPRSTGDGVGLPLPKTGDRLVERIEAYRPSVVVFGAGHVGLAVGRAFAPLPFRLSLLDLRPEAAAPGVEVLAEAALLRAAATPADFILIMTHSHELDYRLTHAALTHAALTHAALTHGGEGYVGLIGSATKRARFLSRLGKDGAGPAAVARLVCPIGLASLKSKAPEVIAVSVAADLLQRVEAVRE
jgi:xanthine dehydrogenase accessory factor